jgi:hypothetical protein
MDDGFVAAVKSHADEAHSTHLSKIFRAPDLTGGNTAIGDAKFGGVSLGMPGANKDKRFTEPAQSLRISAPAEREGVEFDDPLSEFDHDIMLAINVEATAIAAVVAGVLGVFALRGYFKDKAIKKLLSLETERIERKRKNDLRRARAGDDPYNGGVEALKRRIRDGEDGGIFLRGQSEMWEDAVRALVETIVEDRETNIPDSSPRSRRRRAISEVRYLVRGESRAIFKSPWFHSVREDVSFGLFRNTYDSSDTLRRVALARLVTLEKAVQSNGSMDWAKAAIEEMRLIDPEWLAEQG